MKKFVPILMLAVALLATPPSHALTPAERTIVQQTQSQLRAGIAKYKEADQRASDAQSAADQANQRAAGAENNVITLQGHIVTLTGQVKAFSDKADLIATERDKYKRVYDECNKYWGIGAILYGIKDLTKHIFIMIAVIVVVAVGIWVLSIAVPVTAPFIKIGVFAVGSIFKAVGRGIATGFGALHRLLQRLLIKKPAPPNIIPIGT